MDGDRDGAVPGDGQLSQGRVPLATIAREWGRIGCLGFGGPPAHIAMLRALCVQRRGWISAAEFDDGIAATNLLPGPASTQLAILTARWLRGTRGALVGGICFISPGLVMILGLSTVFLSGHPPRWVHGAAAGAGSAVAAVALHAAWSLAPGSWKRTGPSRGPRTRWLVYVLGGAVAAALIGQWLVLVIVAAGLVEITARRGIRDRPTLGWPLLVLAPPAAGGLLALVWVAVKVGALSYGGGFVIVPMMRADAVDHYHWMTGGQFLNAVALGQITPGPVVGTVAVVGYAAAGLAGGVLAAVFAFAPSFTFVIVGAPRFDRLRANPTVQALFAGASPAVIGAIAGSAIPLALALQHVWQLVALGLAALWLLAARRGVVGTLVGAGVMGIGAALLGWPVS